MSPEPKALLTAEDLMARIPGYRSRDAFVRAMRKAGLRRVKINSRVILYDRQAAEAFIKRRTF